MNNVKYLLDFDGVICDSRPECMVTSYNAYQRFQNKNFQLNFSKQVVPTHFQDLFFEQRYLVRTGPEFKILWDYLLRNYLQDEKYYQSYNHVHNNQDSNEIVHYGKLFYDVRSIWMQKDYQKWMTYNKLYNKIIPALKQTLNKNSLYIVSSKDKKSIELICSYYQVKLPQSIIYSKEFGEKSDLIKKIQNIHPNFSLVFIDDNISNIINVMHSGLDVKLYLATWGYNSTECQNEAVRNQINLLDLDHFFDIFNV